MFKLLRLLSTIMVIGLVTSPASAQTQPVCDVKADNDGDCAVDGLGAPVTVEGTVMAWKHFGDRGPGAIFDSQSGCCISIFDITDAPELPIGTNVRVTGYVSNFAGLAEITDEPGDGSNDPIVVDLGPGTAPAPIPVECGDLADGSALAEDWESCLVSVCGTFEAAGSLFQGSTNYVLNGDDGNSCEIRIDGDVADIIGTVIPAVEVAVVGILSQFDGFSSTCIGYQVLPRSLADLIPGTCGATPIAPTTWGRLKATFSN